MKLMLFTLQMIFVSLAIAGNPEASWPVCSRVNKAQTPDDKKIMQAQLSGRKACEKGCVTLHDSHNGTNRAFLASSTSTAPKKCVIDQPCTICFESGKSCVQTIYKGKGPRKWNFGLSPAFFAEKCGKSDTPAPLNKECQALKTRVMKPTIYSDGYSCPKKSKGCTVPHVVFNKVHNGSARAFLPSSSATNPEKCKNGEKCRVCFKHGEDCIDILYLGTGPSTWRLDFPPAFFKDQCNKNGIPAALKKQCKSFDRQVKKMQKQIDSGKKINCFEQRDNPQCASLIRSAELNQKSDAEKRLLCLKLGQKVYNATRAPEEQRIYGCNYSKKSKQWEFPNKKRQCIRKTRWKILLPGSCPAGTFVGKYGLNCCSKDIFTGIATGSGCKMYYPDTEENSASRHFTLGNQ